MLLLPARVAARAVAASRRLDSPLRLGPRAVPHVTLAMGLVPANAVEAIGTALRETARRHLPIELTATGARGVPGPRHVNAWYEIDRTRALMLLHREALAIVAAHRVRQRAHREMFAVAPGERLSASTRRWTSRFADESSGPRYRPHVTLGRGQPSPAAPFTFRATALALFQLGPDCTCARRLAAAWKRR